MEFTRRTFLRTGLGAAGAACWAHGTGPARQAQPYFGLHPDIEANPKAVFICRTRVPHKLDMAAKRNAGLSLAREIFVSMDHPGIPISHRIILKPNATGMLDRSRPAEETLGVGTDAQFYEGMVMGLKELGASRFHFIESTEYPSWNVRGFVDINERLGIAMNDSVRRPRQLRECDQTNWSKVPDGVIFSRIPHYAPVGEPGTWLLNIAKWKAHSMGMTQSVKNEQGLVAHPFTAFCSDWAGVIGVPEHMKPDMNPRAQAYLTDFFERHKKKGYSRYTTKGAWQNGQLIAPITQEIWAHKTCDNQSTLDTGLNMIEGIYGRDGDGFDVGNDHLTNLVMFGKQNFRLDVIGLYLAGHEPGNIHLYRIAKERGLTDTFNPWEIPIYEWVDGHAVPRKLSDFARTPLRSVYLPHEREPCLHLINEPFDYERNRA